jgi:hypothetical protein
VGGAVSERREGAQGASYKAIKMAQVTRPCASEEYSRVLKWGFEPIFFEIESPFLAQFWSSWDGTYGFIGRVGRKPPKFVE